MVTPTAVTQGSSTYSYSCKTDADCIGERKTAGGTVVTAAVTDATAKAKICCMYYEIVTAPTGTNKAAGDTTLLSYKTAFGLPNTAGEATKYCSTDYPDTIKGLGLSGTYDAKTGEYTAKAT